MENSNIILDGSVSASIDALTTSDTDVVVGDSNLYNAPTSSPTSSSPTLVPTNPPVTSRPTIEGETNNPTSIPTSSLPSAQPSSQPSRQPTDQPTGQPTSQPTQPTSMPTGVPTLMGVNLENSAAETTAGITIGIAIGAFALGKYSSLLSHPSPSLFLIMVTVLTYSLYIYHHCYYICYNHSLFPPLSLSRHLVLVQCTVLHVCSP